MATSIIKKQQHQGRMYVLNRYRSNVTVPFTGLVFGVLSRNTHFGVDYGTFTVDNEGVVTKNFQSSAVNIEITPDVSDANNKTVYIEQMSDWGTLPIIIFSDKDW